MPRAAHAKHIQLAMFFSSLHFARYYNINLKAKQVRCLEVLFFGKDVVVVLPKGYGKIIMDFPSSSFAMLRHLSVAHEILVVVSSLNALMKDPICRTEERNLKATILGIKRAELYLLATRIWHF